MDIRSITSALFLNLLSNFLQMKKLFTCLCLFLFCSYSFSQSIIQRDPIIEKMVAEISKDSIRSYIKTLVAFGTRNTLSTQSDPNRGIGAARKWVLSRFDENSASASDVGRNAAGPGGRF